MDLYPARQIARRPHVTYLPAWFLLGWVLCTGCGASAGRAQTESNDVPDRQVFPYRDATFEELADLTITSVSKVEENHFRTAASVQVITAEDIRRSGALSLPDVLRMAPGVEVAQINSRSYAVTVRGFNGSSANKVLPLVDGRSLYSQRFGGTIWEIRDLPLEDIQQIDVVGGSGGTTWGSNAVNGVINIVTKHARNTQGEQVSAGGGIYEQAFVYARKGVQLGGNRWLRVYAKAFARDDSEPVPAGVQPVDSLVQYRTGFRYDQEPALAVQTMVTGDFFYMEGDQRMAGVKGVSQSRGGHLLGRHEVALENDGRLSLQGYYDGFRRESASNISDADVFDAELRHERAWGERQRVTVGTGYRMSRLQDEVRGAGFVSSFQPEVRWFNQGNVFVQDVVALTPDTWTLTAGTKAEYNDFTGVEVLPSARLAWTPSRRLTVWGAYSRAVRIPSRFENDQFLSQTRPGFTIRTLPNGDVEAEVLNTFELGVRHQTTPALTLGTSVYLNEYDNLVTSEPVAGVVPPNADFISENRASARSAGAEMSANWQATDWWRLVFTGSFIDLEIESDAGSGDTNLPRASGLSPEWQLGLRSLWNIGDTWEVDAWLRWVDALESPVAGIPSYTSLDLRIGKQLGRGWEVSLVGRNLLQPSHPEFIFAAVRSEVPRSIYLRFDWRR